MFVRSQDKTIVLNNEKVIKYMVSDSRGGNFRIIAAEGEGANYTEIVLGRYRTEKKCKIVLDMLMDCYTMNLLFERGQDENPRDLVCDYVADQPLGVFEMPQEDEIE